jgi:hypothetical protein
MANCAQHPPHPRVAVAAALGALAHPEDPQAGPEHSRPWAALDATSVVLDAEHDRAVRHLHGDVGPGRARVPRDIRYAS